MHQAIRWFALICLFSCLLVGGPAHAGEDYFLLMFGSQRVPANPNYSHTFATFVRGSWPGDGPCQGNMQLEAHTISWLPANLKVRTGALLPECGHNFDLPESLDFAYRTDQRVSLWGPYRIHPELYHRALAQKAKLESGSIKYKANDMGYHSDRVSNCIHAVSSTVDGPKLRVASPGWGESASYFVVKQMEPWIFTKCPVPEIGSALGLDQYPIIYRDWGNPRSNAATGTLFRLFGGERDLRTTYGPPSR